MKKPTFITHILSDEEEAVLIKTIEAAELNTSGEIRVHIEKRCKHNVLDKAANTFKQLKMDKTALRNGVLIYLAVEDKKFAIIGDKGINDIVPDNFWDEAKNEMQKHFKAGEMLEGLRYAIDKVGKQLKEHFPYQKDDVNELPNEISYGKDDE
ncbi:MAG: hypothetical protein CSA94_01205 [Bacteroidetes bacterium]|nr:MAG: hypothetical protein CSA94_01205 [Bacteroidota bacterium]